MHKFTSIPEHRAPGGCRGSADLRQEASRAQRAFFFGGGGEGGRGGLEGFFFFGEGGGARGILGIRGIMGLRGIRGPGGIIGRQKNNRVDRAQDFGLSGFRGGFRGLGLVV